MPVGVVRTHWAGTSGGPGLTQLFFQDATGASISSAQATTVTGAVRTFWSSVATYLPDEINLTVSPAVDVYDIPSQELVASVTATAIPANVLGASTVVYSMAAGLKVNLITNVIATGRRVKGAIYIVPAGSNAFSVSGVALPAARTAINTAGNTLLTNIASAGCNLVVYSRPKIKDGLEVNGHTSVVATLEVNEKTAILRGRRD